jgi:predicted dehydrogenase
LKKNIFNAAIVGFGHIGKLHLETISSIKELNVCAIVDSAPVESELPVFPSIKECHLSHPEIDLYIIATPNGYHYQQAKEVLELQKNVLVEKPIALHKKQVEELITLSHKYNVRIFTSLQLRFSPVIDYVKKLCEKNLLGQLYLVSVECFWNRNTAYYEKSSWHGTQKTDGGILFTQFSHFLDILFYLLGNLELVSSKTENFSHQNCIDFPDTGILQFKSGETLGSMVYTISTYEKNFESSITLIAEKGTIKISGQYMNQLLYHHVENTNPVKMECKTTRFHKDLYENILLSLDKNIPSIADAENTMDVIEFIEKIMKE